MSATYLAKLNKEQRQAVEHGVGPQADGPAKPLLVIAGAGSGKTNTLAHRGSFDRRGRRRPTPRELTNEKPPGGRLSLWRF